MQETKVCKTSPCDLTDPYVHHCLNQTDGLYYFFCVCLFSSNENITSRIHKHYEPWPYHHWWPKFINMHIWPTRDEYEYLKKFQCATYHRIFLNFAFIKKMCVVVHSDYQPLLNQARNWLRIRFHVHMSVQRL